MKKIINIIFCLMIILTNFYVPDVAYAKTLGDLKTELKEQQAKLQEGENKKNQTQAEINKTNSEVASIRNNISNSHTDITNLDKEIVALNKDIANKEEEIKKIVNYTQVSNGESAYLEYAFGAQDFTDFIYRVAIAEQLTTYNEKLIDDFNKSIEESKKKQVELNEKISLLETQQKDLETKIKSLGTELVTASDIIINAEDEIEVQKEIIETYEKRGCNDSDNINTCGRTTLPVGTAFYRPIESGYVTSFYGNRTWDGWHYGIDVSTPVTAPAIYAAGTGEVSVIWPKYSCGGNMVFINHNINGRTYTTLYAHLLKINVSVGDIVTRNTVIGYMGGGYNTTTSGGGWDSPRCTTGQHLHFQIATGLYGKLGTDGYITYAAFTARTFDPSTLVNFPNSEYSWFYDRITAY